MATSNPDKEPKVDFFTIFIFPFKYERAGTRNGGGKKGISPQEAARLLEDASPAWHLEKEFTFKEQSDYNEFYYFHQFVREAIYSISEGIDRPPIMAYLTRNDYKRFEVSYANDVGGTFAIKTIYTEVKSIDIHLFDNQVGLLTITTEKRPEDASSKVDDLLIYNDIGRRVYSPYVSLTTSENWKEYLEAEKGRAQKTPKEVLELMENASYTAVPKLVSGVLPTRVSLSGDAPTKPLVEEFTMNKFSKRRAPILSTLIRRLLIPFQYKESDDLQQEQSGVTAFSSFTDDRMFVVSYYSEDDTANFLGDKKLGGFTFESSDLWYRFIFVDGKTLGIANDKLKEQLIHDHTYTRWAGYGTLFGMSRYSLVALCDTSFFSRTVLKPQMKSMYYQMALIILFQRAMLLKFDSDVSALSKKFNTESFANVRTEATELLARFIRFTSHYWFVEVTPQEQGIELYTQWKRIIGLDELFAHVEKAIHDLSEYIENQVGIETDQSVERLTFIGMPVAIIVAITGAVDLWKGHIHSFMIFGRICVPLRPFWLWFCSSLTVIIVSACWWSQKRRARNQKK